MKLFTILIVFAFSSIHLLCHATKLVEVKVVDKDYIMIFFKDGEVTYNETNPDCLYGNCADAAYNARVTYGTALNTTNAASTTNWVIKSLNDANFGSAGKNPTNVYRKSKLNGMSQENWGAGDYNYDWAYDHQIFLKLPFSMEQGKTYTIEINSNTNTDVTTRTISFDIFNSKSEAVKVNLVGYQDNTNVKAADLYMWLGDGAARDYSSFVGKKVYLYNVTTKTSQEVSTIALWKTKATEFTHNHKMIESNVWKADFTGFNTPGTYRLAIEGVGCSENFEIKNDIYRDPFLVSTLGFYYMRIGESTTARTPVPRQPQYIPNVSPSNCKVYLTTMHPYHAQWGSFTTGDQWDQEQDWVQFKKSGNPTNANAFGGHSDALDWDRHLGHVSIIYDMLLPYFLSGGNLSDDDLGIPESGNGIPDIIDEARNEVDFWLRLRDGKGYSHGLTNPGTTNDLYQSAPTGVAAWANAANAAMLSNCFMISGHTALMEQYRDSAIAAYNYANALSDPMLTNSQNVGAGSMRGRDFKMTAAAFLYNVTGNTVYENFLNTESLCTSTTAAVWSDTYNQMYATAGYLFTNQSKHFPSLYSNMKASMIYQAKQKEANYTLTRPSRRSNNNTVPWFHTELANQHSIIAHAIADPGADKEFLLDALILEADWTLGRNPLNMIQMTTATTSLATKKSVEQAYTSGWNDGVQGVHPGHTPYMNVSDWGGLIMGNPSWMTSKNYPAHANWPYGEEYYNVRYVYAANEFTPQQTMRGKQALYGYLYSLSSSCPKPNLGNDQSICGQSSITLNSGLSASGKTFIWYKDNVEINGQSGATLSIASQGTYKVKVDSASCSKTDEISISGDLILNLGEDKNLCDPTEYTLDAGNATVPGITYVWNTGATTQTITVNKSGTYTVTISTVGCASKTDAVIVTSQLLNVTDDTLCDVGVANLSVTGTNTYSWYDVVTNGSVLSTGNSYSPAITDNKVFYVEEANSVAGTLGKVTAGTGTSWALGGADLGGTDKINQVSVLQPITLTSIDVYNVTNNNSITINIKQGSTVIHTKTLTGIATGKQTLPLNFAITPGDYIIDAVGTTGSLTFEASGATFPYSYAGYISFNYNISWQSGWYGLFYNWKFTAGSTCARTPVHAVIDINNPNCTITNLQTSNDENNLFVVYPNPATNQLIIKNENLIVEQPIIANTLGQHLNYSSFLIDNSSLNIDVSQFEPGIYFIKFGNQVKKFIKE